FLTSDSVHLWAEQNGVETTEKSTLGDLLTALRRQRLDPFVGQRIGRYIRATRLVTDVNFLSGTSMRYRYRLEVESEARRECEIFKRLAFDVVFRSPQLKQLEHKGSRMLRMLWDVLAIRYIDDG